MPRPPTRHCSGSGSSRLPCPAAAHTLGKHTVPSQSELDVRHRFKGRTWREGRREEEERRNPPAGPQAPAGLVVSAFPLTGVVLGPLPLHPLPPTHNETKTKNTPPSERCGTAPAAGQLPRRPEGPRGLVSRARPRPPRGPRCVGSAPQLHWASPPVRGSWFFRLFSPRVAGTVGGP